MRWNELVAEDCPLARALSVLGDRWTMLILRDALRGVTRYDEFHRRLACSRGMVAKRLTHLVECGVMETRAYQTRPVRMDYLLTAQGRALGPALMMLTEWAEEWLPRAAARPVVRRHRDCGAVFRPVVVCSECHAPLAPDAVEYPDPAPDPAIRAPGPRPFQQKAISG